MASLELYPPPTIPVEQTLPSPKPDASSDDHCCDKTFTKFNELPKELRLHIWELALPEPRVVYLSCLSTFESHAPIPSMLLACHESSEVASRHFSRTASGRSRMRETYFDFKRDILFVDQRSFGLPHINLSREEIEAHKVEWERTTRHRRMVQHLCLGTDVLDYYIENGYEAEVVSTLACFGNVRVLTLAINHTVFASRREVSALELVDIPGVETKEGNGMDQPVPANFGYSRGTFSLNSEWMERRRLGWFAFHSEQASWQLPRFQYKTVASVSKPRSANRRAKGRKH